MPTADTSAERGTIWRIHGVNSPSLALVLAIPRQTARRGPEVRVLPLYQAGTAYGPFSDEVVFLERETTLGQALRGALWNVRPIPADCLSERLGELVDVENVLTQVRDALLHQADPAIALAPERIGTGVPNEAVLAWRELELEAWHTLTQRAFGARQYEPQSAAASENERTTYALVAEAIQRAYTALPAAQHVDHGNWVVGHGDLHVVHIVIDPSALLSGSVQEQNSLWGTLDRFEANTHRYRLIDHALLNRLRGFEVDVSDVHACPMRLGTSGRSAYHTALGATHLSYLSRELYEQIRSAFGSPSPTPPAQSPKIEWSNLGDIFGRGR